MITLTGYETGYLCLFVLEVVAKKKQMVFFLLAKVQGTSIEREVRFSSAHRFVLF